ncbi:MAG: hypothetical protein U1E99_06650 [Agitococcus sp.]
MITKQSLALDQPIEKQKLPLFWRLGKLNTGQPLLWPINYQQPIIIKCVHKTHETAHRFLETLLLSLWQQTGGQQLQIVLYEASLKRVFHYSSQLPVQVLYHKQHVKKHIADLHALAQQRQDILKQLNYVSWFDYINQQSQVEPLQLVVLSQLWPDPELLADLSDLCRYGGQFGILPVLVVSEHFFPAIADDWYAQFLEECCLKALVVELKQGYYVQIKHHQLQEIADLYAFFKPKIDRYSESVLTAVCRGEYD